MNSYKILFVYDFFLHCLIILKFGTEHGIYNAVLCAKFQNYWTTKTKVMS